VLTNEEEEMPHNRSATHCKKDKVCITAHDKVVAVQNMLILRHILNVHIYSQSRGSRSGHSGHGQTKDFGNLKEKKY
jgi:hypothetical protein